MSSIIFGVRSYLKRQVYLHAGCAVAGRQTLDFFVGEQAVFGGLEMADAQMLAK